VKALEKEPYTIVTDSVLSVETPGVLGTAPIRRNTVRPENEPQVVETPDVLRSTPDKQSAQHIKHKPT
ncbi:hypothetical protein, partial [Achromobacter sp.]|uniref:hypothetical protein n=1 Tax=Achromobacter sp. TaxID=134375 RepID=UPI0031CEE8D3